MAAAAATARHHCCSTLALSLPDRSQPPPPVFCSSRLAPGRTHVGLWHGCLGPSGTLAAHPGKVHHPWKRVERNLA